MSIRPLDIAALKLQYARAEPFPHVKIDNFLEGDFAEQLASAYPSFDTALAQGRSFKTVNERKKVQITDHTLFPEPVRQLSESLASPRFLADLTSITGIPSLLADSELVGGGMHITGPGGRLDVHVDFNYLQDRDMHRRLNLLLYLNQVWDEEWGGHIQLWDETVSECCQAFPPLFNRCVIFETSRKSFHGVTPVTSKAPVPRKSFATYYYTSEAPSDWDGLVHSTIFKARPDERMRGNILMPLEQVGRQLDHAARQVRSRLKRVLHRE